MKDVVMDVVVTSVLKQSCLSNVAKGSDYLLRTAEAIMLRKDSRSTCPIQSSATRRLVPLAINHLGLRGGHFQALLKEFATDATILVTTPGGCVLLEGPLRPLHQRRPPQDPQYLGFPSNLDCSEGARLSDCKGNGCIIC